MTKAKITEIEYWGKAMLGRTELFDELNEKKNEIVTNLANLNITDNSIVYNVANLSKSQKNKSLKLILLRMALRLICIFLKTFRKKSWLSKIVLVLEKTMSWRDFFLNTFQLIEHLRLRFSLTSNWLKIFPRLGIVF